MGYLISKQDILLMDSREVAEIVEKDHAHLLRAIRTFISAISTNPNLDALNFFRESTYEDAKGETRPCYKITKMGCEMIANKMTGQKGILFTAAYVQKFNEMEQQASSYQLPASYAEALRELATTVEVNEKLAQENALLKPKAEFFDAVADSKTAIEIGEAAKVLAVPGIGRNKLFDVLRKSGVLMKDNKPYQEFIDRGYFRVVEQKFEKPNGDTCINIKTLVYQRGLDYIRRMLSKEVALTF